MCTVYVIRSESTGSFYIGCTGNLERRLLEHNTGQTRSTRGRGPWRLVRSEVYPSLVDARRREHEIKSWKSRRNIEQLIAGGWLGW